MLGSFICLEGTNSVNSTKGCVTFTFDDGYASVYSTAYPIMAKYGYNATVFVITGKVDQENHMTLPQLKQLQDDGWDISSHTKSHPNLAKQQNITVVIQELADSKKWLISNGFASGANFFAAPYYAYNPEVKGLAGHCYAVACLGRGGINPLSSVDLHSIVRYATCNSTSVAQITSMIRQADLEGGWLVLTFHSITDNTPSRGTYCAVATFEAVLQYCHSNHVNVKSINEVYQKILIH
jgi:peptidoglycan/xylan/chitin deacetylase (PgdA/CDA1 family)